MRAYLAFTFDQAIIMLLVIWLEDLVARDGMARFVNRKRSGRTDAWHSGTMLKVHSKTAASAAPYSNS